MMVHRSRIHLLAPALVLGALAPAVVAGDVGAASTRTKGEGRSVWLSWTEYDPTDALGLPGNVHVGYLYAESGAYGSYLYGNVTDFDCDEGETPWGGGHGLVEDVADEAADAVDDAVADAIETVIESGAAAIDAGEVVDTVGDSLSDELTDVVEDEFEEFPACDYVQDRFIDGSETATVKVNSRTKTARITGTVTVHGGHGDHGEPGTVLGTPPIDVTIRGGDWEKFEWSYSSRTAWYSFAEQQKGTNFHGGTVFGRIGPMGFADDADDESFGGFGTYTYHTVERVR